MQEGGSTPMMEEHDNSMMAMTPYVEGTPVANHGGRTSEYGGMTPAATSVYEASFSPGANLYASPAYASPNYASPVYSGMQSPIYGKGGKI